jgi:hypothetical protein
MCAYDNALRAQDQDWALIARQIRSALQTLYEPIVCERLPDSMAGLIERIAAREARRGEQTTLGVDAV